MISYPRTSSQKLPTSINYKKIISNLARIGYHYTKLAATLFARDNLSPNEGSKTDPAHPATQIGFEIIQSMRKYVPSVASTDLTRSMKEQLDEIESGKVRSTIVIKNAIDELKRTMCTFKKNDVYIQEEWSTYTFCKEECEHFTVYSSYPR